MHDNSFRKKKNFFSILRSSRYLWAAARTLKHGRLCFSKKTRTFEKQPQKTQVHDASHGFQSQALAVTVDVRACACLYPVCVSLSLCVCVCVCVFLCVLRGFLSHSSVKVVSACPPSPFGPLLHLCLSPYTPPPPSPPRARSPHACRYPFNVRALVYYARRWLPAPHVKSSPARGAL